MDWTERDIKPLRDMVINKYIDSEGNRALSIVEADLPIVGKTTCNTFVDFNKKTLVKSVEGKDWCWQLDLPMEFNLKEYIEKLKCQEGGLAEYIGDRSVIWDREKQPTIYHAFRVDHKGSEWDK